MLIDKYAYISALSSIAPERKLSLGLVALLGALFSGRLAAFAVLFVLMSALTVGAAKIPVKTYVQMLLLPLGFLLLSVLGIVVNVQTSPGLAVWFSADALPQALYLGAKAMTAVSCLYFIILTTSMRDTIAMLRFFHCPALITTLATLIYRCIFILLDVATTKVRSMQCRHAFLQRKGSLRAFGMLWGSVFIQSMQNAQWMYQAMQVRGHDQEMRFLPLHPQIRAKDVLGLTLLVVTLIALNQLPF
ncbi:Transmembrane component CbiQ of energizing module of cobalt ECF transporter [Clostridiaceae bacterium JG1575]|nr:Transmembrane component CbiQ of energizing module of cobalt ECF transporter [Clostridiaceae bacterium JG1575]